MNIGTVGNMAVVAKGWVIIDFGFALLKKKDKNEEERRAAKSFSAFFSLLCMIVALTLIILFITVTLTVLNIAGTMGSNRYGTVKDDSIGYVQGEMKYLPISGTGLEEYDLQEGDRIVMVFDSHTDELIRLVPEKQQNQKLLKYISIMLGSLFGCVILLAVFSIVGQGTVGRQFSLYYNLSLKRENGAWSLDERRKIYEDGFIQAFGQKKSLWFQGGMAIVALLLIIGLTVSCVLIWGEVYALAPSRNLVLLSRCFGAASFLLQIGLMCWYAKYDHDARPLYSAGEHLLNTQLLTRNMEGKIGCYTISGTWAELQEVKVKRQDEKMVQMKCRYKLSSNGKEFSELNYIAKDDMIYPLVMTMNKSGEKAASKSGRYGWQMGLILFIYIVLLVSNILLLKERDKNTISFPSATSQSHACMSLATVVRDKDPAACYGVFDF